MKRRSKAGRPRKSGERYACGKLKPEQTNRDHDIGGAATRRILDEGIAFAMVDKRLRSQLAMLRFNGRYSALQVAVGWRIAGIFARHERNHGRRRSAPSPAYEMGISAAASGPRSESFVGAGRVVEEERRIRREQRTWERLCNKMNTFGAAIYNAIEELCVDDRPIDPSLVDRVGTALDNLAVYFGMASPPHGGVQTVYVEGSKARPIGKSLSGIDVATERQGRV